MVEQGECVVGVILYGKSNYAGGDFISYCDENHIQVYDFLEADTCFAQYKNNLDMLYSCIFPKKIKKRWIEAAKVAAINFHPAPLPEYRGVFGYNFAFLNHESSYGVSCHFLVDQFDEGDIIEVKRFPYNFEDGSLKELIGLSDYHMFDLFQRIYTRFKNGETVKGAPQTRGRYYSRKDFEREKHIDLADAAGTLDKIKAFWYPPFEGAYIKIGDRKIMLVPEDEYRNLCGTKDSAT